MSEERDVARLWGALIVLTDGPQTQASRLMPEKVLTGRKEEKRMPCGLERVKGLELPTLSFWGPYIHSPGRTPILANPDATSCFQEAQ